MNVPAQKSNDRISYILKIYLDIQTGCKELKQRNQYLKKII